ncbi:MAG: adenosylcobinamide-GDP ribazoletransferase [Mycobacteriaceae bacterium]
MNGVRLAVSWLTVLPLQGPATVDRAVAARAITLAPLIGAALGAAAAAGLWVLLQLQAPPLLAGLLTVALLALATRGMHLDGLADTVDGLGCYGTAQRALAVMRDGATGPFAVVALVLVLGADAVGLSWHTTRRFGGLTGDVLGAGSELAVMTVVVVLALG